MFLSRCKINMFKLKLHMYYVIDKINLKFMQKRFTLIIYCQPYQGHVKDIKWEILKIGLNRTFDLILCLVYGSNCCGLIDCFVFNTIFYIISVILRQNKKYPSYISIHILRISVNSDYFFYL